MALNSRKITTYIDNVKDLSNRPSENGLTAEALKAFFDGRGDKELKSAINGLIDDLIAVSGATQIGTTTYADISATNIQDFLQQLAEKRVTYVGSNGKFIKFDIVNDSPALNYSADGATWTTIYQKNADWNAMSGVTQIVNKPTTIAGYGIADAYTKTEIDNKVSAVYRHKGTVADYNLLPTTDLTIGDVYNVTTSSEGIGVNYAWNGTDWDNIGGTEPLATADNNGLLSKEGFSKLEGIQQSANNYSHPDTHPASIITVEDSGSRFAAETVEGVLAELFDRFPCMTQAEYDAATKDPNKFYFVG